jgi:hypothetical protein
MVMMRTKSQIPKRGSCERLVVMPMLFGDTTTTRSKVEKLEPFCDSKNKTQAKY